MHDSPRIRRLRNDHAAIERLATESSVVRFRARGNPVQHYMIEFMGKSLERDRGKVIVRERHEVEIKLGASYPRTIPEIRWLTPIYHPNISEIGMVCLGGYGTHWVPSLTLDELCTMLWDMARYHNYDIRSPYNRDAALWVANQASFRFPLDSRPLRNLRAALGRSAAEAPAPPRPAKPAPAPPQRREAVNGQSDRTGRYTEFVRRFRESLQAIEAAAVRTSDQPTGNGAEADRGAAAPEGLILLDMEVDLRPLPPAPPRTAPQEEIVFID
jgi:ubiquitin-protein ligase